MKIKNYAWTFGSRILVIGLNAAFGIISARLLGPTDKGIYTVATLMPAMLSTLAMLAGPQLVVIDLSGGGAITRRLNRLLKWSSASAAVLALCFLLSQFIIDFTETNYISKATVFIGITVMLAPTLIVPEYFAAFLQASQKFRELAILRIAQVILPGLLMFIGLFSGGLLNALMGFVIGTSIVGFVTTCLWRKRSCVFSGEHKAELKIPWSYVLITNFSLVLLFLSYRIDVFILNIVSTSEEVGLYSAAVALSELVLVASMSISVVRAPIYARNHGFSLKRDLWIVIYISLILTLILGFLNPFVIPLLFGHAYQGSVNVVWVLLPGILCLGVYRFLSNAEIVRGHKYGILVSCAISLLVDIVFVIIYGKEFGAMAAGLGATLAYASGLFYLIVHRRCRSKIAFFHK